MKKSIIAASVAAAVSGIAIISFSNADDNGNNSHFSRFKQLDESANRANFNAATPWKLPRGFSQRVVSDESDLNIYLQPTYTDRSNATPEAQSNDWHDMNTVNETGHQAGRFMYRTHEVRNNNERGGTVSVVDLKTGESKLIAEDPSYNAIDGIVWTPWGTVLFAEETTNGRLFELVPDANDPSVAAAVIDRPAVGRLAHEGIEVDHAGNVYVVDEYRGRTESRESRGNTCGGLVSCGGGIYKFIPSFPGDLSDGELYVLKVNGADGVGQGEWLGPIDPLNARAAGSLAGGQSYQRPEDIEVIDNVLYVAITEGPRDVETDLDTGALAFQSELYEGRVIAINLDTLEVVDFVKPGVNVPREIGRPGDEGHQTGFDSVDNLAKAPDGSLVMIEDNVPSDIWFASTRKLNDLGASKKVKLFASLTDPSAEGTGIYFSPMDPHTLYVNIQHSSVDDGDGTWAITRNRSFKKHDDKDDD
jgi:hypothetical protein